LFLFLVWFDRVGLVVGNLKGCQVQKRIALFVGVVVAVGGGSIELVAGRGGSGCCSSVVGGVE